MTIKPKSIRSFIGAKDFSLSRSFYKDVGFEEVIISPDMSLFKIGDFGFYLQDAYVKEWIENSMIFLEVENLAEVLQQLTEKDLEARYLNVKISRIHFKDWGNEFFVHDPSGILWHIGEFK